MDVLTGPVLVVLSANEASALGRQLGEAIRSAYTVRGQAAPRVLLDFAIAVNTAARSGQVPQPEPAEFRTSTDMGPSFQPATVSIAEAAQAAGCSEGYMRRLVRRGDVEALQDRPGGTYAVAADSLAAWMGRRRKENDRKAA